MSREHNEELISNLDGQTDADVEEAWNEEIARRVAELESGTVKTVLWAEARRRIMKRN